MPNWPHTWRVTSSLSPVTILMLIPLGGRVYRTRDGIICAGVIVLITFSRQAAPVIVAAIAGICISGAHLLWSSGFMLLGLLDQPSQVMWNLPT